VREKRFLDFEIAILVATAILGTMWASWGIKYGRKWKEKSCK
jgi:hypothetical protein